MNQLNTATFVPTAPSVTGTITSVSSYVIQIDVSNCYLGACFDASGTTFMIVASCNASGTKSWPFVASGNNYYLVDVIASGLTGATVTWNNPANSTTPGSSNTNQSLFEQFANGPSQKNYSYCISGTVNQCNTDEFYKTGKGRVLFAIDDGSVVLDTSKCDISSNVIYSLGSNSYQNYNNKIKITTNASGLQSLTSSNAFDVSFNSVAKAATLTVGTAGGNFINENHNTRPEMLLALLSTSGQGFANRYSSSVSSVQQYFANRLGNTTEQNIGTLRLSAQQII